MIPATFQLGSRRRSLHRFLFDADCGASGIAAIELGLIAPMLALLVVASFDLGMGLYREMQVQTAAQAGAQYAIAHGFSTSISGAVTSATSFSSISASPAPSKFCGCISNSAISKVACTSVCGDGTSPGTYVQVSSQATYTTIIPYPIIPSSFALSSQSTVRIQ